MSTYEEYVKRRIACRKIRKRAYDLLRKVKEMEMQKAVMLVVTYKEIKERERSYTNLIWGYRDLIYAEEGADLIVMQTKANELKTLFPNYYFTVFEDNAAPVPRKFQKPKGTGRITKILMRANKEKKKEEW